MNVKGVRHRHREERGATAVEYGLLIAGVAAVIVVVVFSFGGVVAGLFDETCTRVVNGVTPGNACP